MSFQSRLIVFINEVLFEALWLSMNYGRHYTNLKQNSFIFWVTHLIAPWVSVIYSCGRAKPSLSKIILKAITWIFLKKPMLYSFLLAFSSVVLFLIFTGGFCPLLQEKMCLEVRENLKMLPPLIIQKSYDTTQATALKVFCLCL